jgi:hypothetical protein
MMRTLALLLLIGGAAHAQTAAKAPESDSDLGIAGHLAFGAATANGLSTAWVARFEDELLLAEPHGSVGPLAGFAIGYDYWRAGRGTWGTSLPVQMILGYRAYGVRITGGLGFDAILLDQVHGDTGFGLYAPLASASAGLDYKGFSLLADVRVVRRWQFGADDFTQWMFTLSVGAAEQHRPPPGRAM